MKPASLLSPAVAVGDRSRLLGFLVLLLVTINVCSSQQFDHIQLARIADSVKAQERTSEKLASSLTKILSFMAAEYLPCEKGWLKLRSSCYLLSTDASTWQESREKCIAKNADLAKVTTDEEYNFLRNLVKGHDTWVGLTDLDVEGIYVWTDGTVHPMIKSWWGQDEPNNTGGSEHCVHYYTSKDNRLNDWTCNKIFRYICEKYTYPIQDLNSTATQ